MLFRLRGYAILLCFSPSVLVCSLCIALLYLLPFRRDLSFYDYSFLLDLMLTSCLCVSFCQQPLCHTFFMSNILLDKTRYDCRIRMRNVRLVLSNCFRDLALTSSLSLSRIGRTRWL